MTSQDFPSSPPTSRHLFEQVEKFRPPRELHKSAESSLASFPLSRSGLPHKGLDPQSVKPTAIGPLFTSPVLKKRAFPRLFPFVSSFFPAGPYLERTSVFDLLF